MFEKAAFWWPFFCCLLIGWQFSGPVFVSPSDSMFGTELRKVFF